MHAALLIAEIVENIFLSLRPLDTLINIQRTCRFFKQVVEGSLHLQQALFFKPIGPPLDFNKDTRHFYHPSTGKYIAPRDHHLLTRPLRDGFNFKAAVQYPGASWRRQLVTQPALAEIQCPVRGFVKPAGEGITLLELNELTPYERGKEGRCHFRGWDKDLDSEWASRQTARELLEYMNTVLDGKEESRYRQVQSKAGGESVRQESISKDQLADIARPRWSRA